MTFPSRSVGTEVVHRTEDPSRPVDAAAQPTFTLHDSWHYKCPYCGAPNGQSCRSTKRAAAGRRGAPRPSHKARVALAHGAASAEQHAGEQRG